MITNSSICGWVPNKTRSLNSAKFGCGGGGGGNGGGAEVHML